MTNDKLHSLICGGIRNAHWIMYTAMLSLPNGQYAERMRTLAHAFQRIDPTFRVIY